MLRRYDPRCYYCHTPLPIRPRVRYLSPKPAVNGDPPHRICGLGCTKLPAGQSVFPHIDRWWDALEDGRWEAP